MYERVELEDLLLAAGSSFLFEDLLRAEEDLVLVPRSFLALPVFSLFTTGFLPELFLSSTSILAPVGVLPLDAAGLPRSEVEPLPTFGFLDVDVVVPDRPTMLVCLPESPPVRVTEGLLSDLETVEPPRLIPELLPP